MENRQNSSGIFLGNAQASGKAHRGPKYKLEQILKKNIIEY